MEILFWFSSLTFFFLFISFRCSFCTWVHIACRLLLSCLLVFFFFLEKVLVVCFNKDGDFVLVQLIHLISFFFYLMKLYLFHLDVASLHGFILHVDYYFLSCFFFLEKVLLICFNLLYVVMFLFLAKLYVVMLKLLCCMLLLKRSVPLFGIFVISSRGFPYLFFFFFFGYM